MGRIQDFYNIHKGKTCLIIGNGPGLGDFPLWFLEMYPSFGTNLIYKLQGFVPTYYTAVDQKVLQPLEKTLANCYPDTPKFIPDSYVDYQARPVYYFHHRPGEIWSGNIDGENMLTRPGIAYSNITHVALQIAYYMGFSLMLCVGLDHTDDGAHFYGKGSPGYQIQAWDDGYKTLKDAFVLTHTPRQIINISIRSNAKGLPRESWENYAKGQVSNRLSGN